MKVETREASPREALVGRVEIFKNLVYGRYGFDLMSRHLVKALRKAALIELQPVEHKLGHFDGPLGSLWNAHRALLVIAGLLYCVLDRHTDVYVTSYAKQELVAILERGYVQTIQDEWHVRCLGVLWLKAHGE